MKKSTLMAMAIAAISMTGCTERVPQSTANAFGQSALIEEIVAGGENMPDMKFVYEQDTLTCINLSDEYNYWRPTTFTYGTQRVDGAQYDVRMTCNSGALGSEMLPTDFYFAIGDNGFAKSAYQVERHADGSVNNSQWNFAYTPEGQLSSYTYTSDRYRVDGALQWTDGDLTMAERRMSVGGSTIYDKVTVYYVSSQIGDPIVNKGKVNIYDGNYGISFNSIISGAYYAGLLGRGPEHMPLMIVRGEGSDATRTNYRWQFNQDGYPVVMTMATAGSDDLVTEYNWRGFAPYATPERVAVNEAVDSIYTVALANCATAPADNVSLMTKELADAIARANAVAVKRGEPWIDYDPWIDGQQCEDASIKSVKILSYNADSAKARIELRPVKGSDTVNTVTVTIVRTPEGWRVSDFILLDGTSLRSDAISFAQEK